MTLLKSPTVPFSFPLEVQPVRSSLRLSRSSIFFFSSYYFLLQPSYEAPREELWGPKTTNVIDASNSYLVPKDAHTYFLYYNGNIIDEISAEEVNASFNYYLPIKNQEEK